jgi:hypothetical protein
MLARDGAGGRICRQGRFQACEEEEGGRRWRLGKANAVYDGARNSIAERLQWWAAAKDDIVVVRTLGTGWTCCGGELARGMLVYARQRESIGYVPQTRS